MSTRATLTVSDDQDSFDIYRHHDGYPQGVHGVVRGISDARKLAWSLPRFQADDFAAAVIATMKQGPGSIYLTSKAEDHADRILHYDITSAERVLRVKVFQYTSLIDDIVPIFDDTIEKAIERFVDDAEV